jgi:ribosomal protein S13
MVTIHSLDGIVESLLRIIVQHLDIEAKTGRNLDTTELSGLAGEVNRFLIENFDLTLPYVSEIKQIRQIRNLVQHGMVDAGPDIPRCPLHRLWHKVVLEW